MRCHHCQRGPPTRGYCCEKAELEALRTVVDEVARHLISEVVVAQSLGALDAVESLAHAGQRLLAVRAPAAA